MNGNTFFLVCRCTTVGTLGTDGGDGQASTEVHTNVYRYQWNPG